MPYELPSLEDMVPSIGRLGRKKSKYTPLPEDEEDSLLSRVMASGTGGLQYIGETLDKPGRAARGLLAGRPSELLNLLPFSDTMGLTDPGKATSGTDLLQQVGLQDKLTPEQEDSQGMLSRLGRGVAGFGAEVLLDPTSYLTLGAGALTKSGKLAKAAGYSTKGAKRYKTLAETVAGATPEMIAHIEEAAVKQGHTLKAAPDLFVDATKPVAKAQGVPMMVTGEMKRQLAELGYMAQDVRDMTPQQAWDAIAAATKPAHAAVPELTTRLPDELLNQKLGGLFGFTSGPLGLLGLPGSHVPQFAQGAKAQAVGKAMADAPEYLTRKLPFVGDTIADAAGEGKLLLKGLFHAPSMGQFTKEGQMAGEFATEARKKGHAAGVTAGQQVAKQLDELATNWHETMGDTLASSPEETSRLVRTAAQLAAETRSAPGVPDVLGSVERLMPGTHTPELNQKMGDVVTGIVQQQDNIVKSINAKGGHVSLMFENDDAPIGHAGRFWNFINNVKRRKARLFKSSFGGAVQRNDTIRHVPGPILNEMMADASFQGLKPEEISSALASRYGKDIEKAVAAGDIKAAEMAGKAGEEAVAINPKDVQDALAEWLSSKQGPGGMGPGVGKFIDDAAVNHGKYMTGAHMADANLEAVHKMFAANPGTVPLEHAFKSAGLKAEAAMDYFGRTFGGDALAKGVSEEAVKAAGTFLAKSQKPEWLEKILDIADNVTRPLKKHLTLPFPSFLTRNAASGIAMNMMDPTIGSTQDAIAYGKSVGMAERMLADPTKYKSWFDEAFANNAISMEHSLGQELGWGFEHATPNPISLKGFKANIQQGRAAAKENVGKVMGALNTPAEIGAKFNTQVEFVNRMSMYHYLRERLGWTADAAAQKVRDLQVDYSALSPFERDAKPLVPFYSYMRRTLPMMLDQLAQRPGGTQAQVVRASNTGRSKNEFVPPYVGEGMSVKLGKDSYLSSLGLPTDQYSDIFAKGPTTLGTIKRTGEKMLGMVNPLIKGPLELVTDRNFYTGQNLSDAHRNPTNSILANQVLHNIPTARYVTTARQLLDDREEKTAAVKAINLLTGAKVTGISGGLDKQQRIAQTKILGEMLREHPELASFTDVYPKKDPKTGKAMELSPEAEKLYRTYHHLQKKGADESKKRAKRPILNPLLSSL